MGKLSRHAQDRVLSLSSHYANISDIVSKLNEEGIDTTRQTVSRFLRVSSKATKTRLNTAATDEPRPKTKLKKEHLDYINTEIEKDQKLSVQGKLFRRQFDFELRVWYHNDVLLQYKRASITRYQTSQSFELIDKFCFCVVLFAVFPLSNVLCEFS